jgi:flavodoxin
MDIVIVFASEYGNTERLARVMGETVESGNRVRVLGVDEALDLDGEGIDLLVVGAPTQIHGLRSLAKPFLATLPARHFRDVAAAAFDTKLPGSTWKTGAASKGVAERLERAGCRLVHPAQSFTVEDAEGPLSDGEEAHAASWIQSVVAAAQPIFAPAL